MTRAVALLLTAIVTSAQAAQPDYIVSQKPICKFHYDERLETRMLSVLQHELTSGGATYYDAKKPVITICRSKADLMFSGTIDRNGQSLLDPPHIFVDVDICSHRILKVDRDDGTTVTNGLPCE